MLGEDVQDGIAIVTLNQPDRTNVLSKGTKFEQTLNEVLWLCLETKRVAAHSTGWMMPCLWIAGAAFDEVTNTLGK